MSPLIDNQEGESSWDAQAGKHCERIRGVSARAARMRSERRRRTRLMRRQGIAEVMREPFVSEAEVTLLLNHEKRMR